jgi:tRNA U38,U39,U40 pseudouridine synthase TruA
MRTSGFLMHMVRNIVAACLGCQDKAGPIAPAKGCFPHSPDTLRSAIVPL